MWFNSEVRAVRDERRPSWSRLVSAIYPLVNIQKAIEHGHRNSGFSHEKWWFSIVYVKLTEGKFSEVQTLAHGNSSQIMRPPKKEWFVPRNANRHWNIGVKLVTPKLADNNCTVLCQMLCSSVLPQGCHFHWKIGDRSIPINTIFSGMNIHLPAILGFTRYQGSDSWPIGNTPKCRGSEAPQVDSFQKFFKQWLAATHGYSGVAMWRSILSWKRTRSLPEIYPLKMAIPMGPDIWLLTYHFLWVSKQHGDEMDNWCLTTVIILPCLYWDYYQQGIPSSKPIRWQRCSSRKTLTMRVRFHEKYEGSWVDENHVTCVDAWCKCSAFSVDAGVISHDITLYLMSCKWSKSVCRAGPKKPLGP